jgi:hypothetical protein
MHRIGVGDEVCIRNGSRLAEDWELPAGAVGRVTECRKVPNSPGHLWIDVDFGRETGFLSTVDAEEFELARDPRFVRS